MKLKSIPFKELIMSRIRKLILDITSIKFLAMVFMGILVYTQIINDYVGIGGILALLGIREWSDVVDKRNHNNIGGD